MKIVEATEIVLDLAAQQWGLVTSAQAGSEGASPVMLSRMVDKAILTRIRSGVYAAEATPWSPATSIRAQWLALDPKTMAADWTSGEPRAVVSHESAAELHGIGDLDSNGIHFTVAARRQTRQPEVVFHVDVLNRQDWEILDGLPVTTPVRTVIDLAIAGHEPDHLIDMIGDILQGRLATRSEIIDGLAGDAEMLGHHFGNKEKLEPWLDQRFPLPVTPAEQMLRQQIDAALASIYEEMRTLISALAPETTQTDSVRSALRTSGLHAETTATLTEAVRNEDFSSIPAKMLAQPGIHDTLTPTWERPDLDREKPSSRTQRGDNQSGNGRDDKVEGQDE